MSKILVTGGAGMLAGSLKKLVKENDNYLFFDIDKVDITNIDDIITIFDKYNIDFIYHFAAYTNVDKAEQEQDKCMKINVKGTDNLTEISIKKNIPILYISTDYVFDGNLPLKYSYNETDKTNPVNFYGKTKLDGEQIVKTNSKHYIIRTEWLYNNLGNHFINAIIDKLKSENSIKVVDDQIGALTYADTLNKIILKLVKTNSYGTYNITDNGAATRYEIAKYIADILNITRCKIQPVSSDNMSSTAKRPKNSKLNLTKIKKLLKIDINDWKTDLLLYINNIK